VLGVRHLPHQEHAKATDRAVIQFYVDIGRTTRGGIEWYAVVDCGQDDMKPGHNGFSREFHTELPVNTFGPGAADDISNDFFRD
jgi:hypothetical protein